MQSVYEAFFFLKMHGGWSFIEAYNLPVKLRNWFVQRLSKHFEDQAEQMKKAKEYIAAGGDIEAIKTKYKLTEVQEKELNASKQKTSNTTKA